MERPWDSASLQSGESGDYFSSLNLVPLSALCPLRRSFWNVLCCLELRLLQGQSLPQGQGLLQGQGLPNSLRRAAATVAVDPSAV